MRKPLSDYSLQELTEATEAKKEMIVSEFRSLSANLPKRWTGLFFAAHPEYNSFLNVQAIVALKQGRANVDAENLMNGLRKFCKKQ